MRTYQALVAEADEVDVSGWGFDWLAGRATEERPPWGYARLLAGALTGVDSALDLQTGGGEVVGEAAQLPRRMVVTEGWAPNAALARKLLSPRGVEVVDVDQDAPLPFADASFDLVSARHPVWSNWPEIERVLTPGGRYLGQHVGPASGFELIEFFLGRLPEQVRTGRSPDRDRAGAAAAGLVVDEIRSARCRMEFFDIGAVAYTLRKLVWWVPDFTSTRYDATLRELDALIRRDGSFVAHSTRLLVRAHKPAPAR